MMKYVELSIYRHDKRPRCLAGDNGCIPNKIRQRLIDKQIKPIIPATCNETGRPSNKLIRKHLRREQVDQTDSIHGY